jgi:DNA-binding transcriptional regulator YdaS (Cro superfamily)
MNLENYCTTISSQTGLARELGVTQGLVWQWLNGRTRITAENALLIEEKTGGVVTKEELRPDIFRTPQTA